MDGEGGAEDRGGERERERDGQPQPQSTTEVEGAEADVEGEARALRLLQGVCLLHAPSRAAALDAGLVVSESDPLVVIRRATLAACTLKDTLKGVPYEFKVFAADGYDRYKAYSSRPAPSRGSTGLAGMCPHAQPGCPTRGRASSTD